MKNLNLLFILMMLPVFANAQKQISKNYEFKGQIIQLDLKYAGNIKLKTSNSESIRIKADVFIDEGDGNEYFELLEDYAEDTLRISSSFNDYFKKNSKNNIYVGKSETQINYQIEVPEFSTLSIKSLTGNILVDEFNGNLISKLVSGNIIIKDHKGSLNLKTVKGNLDVALNEGSVKAKTLMGKIYVDENLPEFKSDRKLLSFQKVSGQVKDKINPIYLETVMGDILMH